MSDVTAEVADDVARWNDPTCTYLVGDEECGASGTVFAVGDAVVASDSRLGSTIRRTPAAVELACTEHLVATITAAEDTFVCSVVMPVAEHPLRGRPAKVGA